MIFLAGHRGAAADRRLASPPAAEPDAAPVAGLWGSFVAFYLRTALRQRRVPGSSWRCALSALMAWTLTLESDSRDSSVRRAGAKARCRYPTRPTLAQKLEPPPQEMPAIDPAWWMKWPSRDVDSAG